MISRSRIRAVSTAALALAALPFAAAAQVPAPEAPPFIQVTGSADVKVRPDRARLNFAVVTEGPTAAEAASQNATQMAAVNAALRATGAAGLVIETWGYSLQPRYARVTSPDTPPRIIGYQATNNVRATVDDVTVVGRLIDAGIGAGSNQVTSLQFEARDTEVPRTEALRRAVQNARSQAETMAAALGVPLGPALEVHGGYDMPRPPIPYMANARMAMEQAIVDTPIEPGEQTVTAQVTIKYRLGTR